MNTEENKKPIITRNEKVLLDGHALIDAINSDKEFKHSVINIHEMSTARLREEERSRNGFRGSKASKLPEKK